jgi:hypothetical protein
MYRGLPHSAYLLSWLCRHCYQREFLLNRPKEFRAVVKKGKFLEARTIQLKDAPIPVGARSVRENVVWSSVGLNHQLVSDQGMR